MVAAGRYLMICDLSGAWASHVTYSPDGEQISWGWCIGTSGNVMLTADGAKVLDFGLAKGLGAGAGGSATRMPTQTQPLTGEGSIVGTLQYMAPEQLEAKKADARSDLWAMGALL